LSFASRLKAEVRNETKDVREAAVTLYKNRPGE
jgi:hypothetical protein